MIVIALKIQKSYSTLKILIMSLSLCIFNSCRINGSSCFNRMSDYIQSIIAEDDPLIHRYDKPILNWLFELIAPCWHSRFPYFTRDSYSDFIQSKCHIYGPQRQQLLRFLGVLLHLNYTDIFQIVHFFPRIRHTA